MGLEDVIPDAANASVGEIGFLKSRFLAQLSSSLRACISGDRLVSAKDGLYVPYVCKLGCIVDPLSLDCH